MNENEMKKKNERDNVDYCKNEANQESTTEAREIIFKGIKARMKEIRKEQQRLPIACFFALRLE